MDNILKSTLTPAQQQYRQIKDNYQDALVFFRMGDFYELFYEDAHIAHNILGITLTARDKDAPNPIPMAWIPYHALEKYLPRLIEAWYKVARVEQTWTVIPGKVVEREVCEIYTPWTYIEGETGTWSIVCALSQATGKEWDSKQSRHLIWWTLVDGQYTTTTCSWKNELLQMIERLGPKEIIISQQIQKDKELYNQLHWLPWVLVTLHHDIDKPQETLKHILWISTLQSIERAIDDWRIHVVALLFVYIYGTKKQELSVTAIQHYKDTEYVHVDAMTLKNLEIFTSSYQSEKKYSLFHVLQCTQTGMGARALKDRLQYPRKRIEIITHYQDQISYYLDEPKTQEHIINTLKTLWDLQRKYTVIMYAQNPTPLQIHQLWRTIKRLRDDTYRQSAMTRWWITWEQKYQSTHMVDTIVGSLQEEEPNEPWSLFIYWIDELFDETRKRLKNADNEIMAYQQYLVNTTWIQNIKIKLTAHLWYSIEITPKDAEKFMRALIPNNSKVGFVRLQSRKAWERFMTPYLDTLQQELIKAQEIITETEKQKIAQIQKLMRENAALWSRIFELIWLIDLAANMAKMSKQRQRIKPTITKPWSPLLSTRVRHPMIEYYLPPDQAFIPNDVDICQGWLHIITWPNMWGKSTYLRKVAIIALMAHAWFWVPAEFASIPLLDWIYARIGSGDNIAKQQSTFMTEMVEMANILHNATPHSLLIIDELWRGTSTYDGLALTQAMCVYIAKKIKAMTLLATHYHELTELSTTYTTIKPFRVTVKETDWWIVFLKRVEEGVISRSYGIDVAKLAGIPWPILENAKEWLKKRMEKEVMTKPLWLFDQEIYQTHHHQSEKLEEQAWLSKKYDWLIKEIKEIDVNTITPVEALLFIQKIKHLLDEL
jgi:DNA mismatch repair protein MutS